MDKLKLLSGTPIEFYDFYIYHPQLLDIAEIGEEKYNQYLSSILVDKQDLEIKDDEINNFQFLLVICYQDPVFEKVFRESLSFFLTEDKNDRFYLDYKNLVIKNFDNDSIINEKQFDEFKQMIRKVNYLPEKKKSEEYNPANDAAKKFIEKQKKKQKKYQEIKSKEEATLYDIVSAVAWKSHIGVKGVWNLTIFQLYDAFERLNIIDHYDKTMYGLYSGTIDQKSVNVKNLNWIKKKDSD